MNLKNLVKKKQLIKFILQKKKIIIDRFKEDSFLYFEQIALGPV